MALSFACLLHSYRSGNIISACFAKINIIIGIILEIYEHC